VNVNVNKDPLWSARILSTSPESVIDVHKRYLQNGADIIETASYQASIPGFQKHLNLSVEKSEELIKLSVKLARQAKDDYCKQSGRTNIFVAGSVGPYGAALADGSEYCGTYCDKISHEELIEWHRPRVKCLVEAGVDLIAFETIPAIREAEALMKLLKEFTNTKAWLSFSSKSMHETSHGENIAIAAQSCLKLAPPNQLLAIGVNCCPPEYTESLLQDIASVCKDFPLVAYPNSGEKWSADKRWSGEKTMSDYFLKAWIDSSARIIGGCCRTTPEDTAKICKFLADQDRI